MINVYSLCEDQKQCNDDRCELRNRVRLLVDFASVRDKRVAVECPLKFELDIRAGFPTYEKVAFRLSFRFRVLVLQKITSRLALKKSYFPRE